MAVVLKKNITFLSEIIPETNEVYLAWNESAYKTSEIKGMGKRPATVSSIIRKNSTA